MVIPHCIGCCKSTGSHCAEGPRLRHRLAPTRRLQPRLLLTQRPLPHAGLVGRARHRHVQSRCPPRRPGQLRCVVTLRRPPARAATARFTRSASVSGRSASWKPTACSTSSAKSNASARPISTRLAVSKVGPGHHGVHEATGTAALGLVQVQNWTQAGDVLSLRVFLPAPPRPPSRRGHQCRPLRCGDPAHGSTTFPVGRRSCAAPSGQRQSSLTTLTALLGPDAHEQGAGAAAAADQRSCRPAFFPVLAHHFATRWQSPGAHVASEGPEPGPAARRNRTVRIDCRTGRVQPSVVLRVVSADMLLDVLYDTREIRRKRHFARVGRIRGAKLNLCGLIAPHHHSEADQAAGLLVDPK